MEAGNNRNMEQFAKDIRERMEQQGRFEKVVIQDVMKNNGVRRCGLLMCSRGSNLVPTVYLEPFFEAYEDGADMEEITGKILESYESVLCEGVDMSFFQNFSMVKSRLCMALVNREMNQGLLAEILYSGILKQAADKTGSDLYILPSSRHEVIAVPVIEEREVAELKEMVMDVNRKELQTEDMLSDNVYVYWREQDRTEIA